MNKKYKLTSSKAFDFVHKRGKSIANTNLVLIYAPTKYSLRVGFSVSKKVGKAVVRNKTKRRLREAFRQMIPYLDQKYNYVIIARPNAGKCDYHTLTGSLKHLLLKAGLVNDIEALNTFDKQ